MPISVGVFFDLLVKEVHENVALQRYYKFSNKQSKSFYFRKAYYCQRLSYIQQHVSDTDKLIWDCGCGYGTTAIFLALNGFDVFGSTLEFYYEHIENRLKYWQKHGDLSSVKFNYENIFDDTTGEQSFDIVIAQDTLHHLEPLSDAISIFAKVLKPGGKIIAIEENGKNIVQNLKLFLQRGNNRIVTFYDERLQRDILLGNENIRSIDVWIKAFGQHNLQIDNHSIEYVRLYPPFSIGEQNYAKVIAKEQHLWRTNALLKNRFFFGLNFIVKK